MHVLILLPTEKIVLWIEETKALFWKSEPFYIDARVTDEFQGVESCFSEIFWCEDDTLTNSVHFFFGMAEKISSAVRGKL